MVSLDLEILAVVARALYNHLCLRSNTSVVSGPRPIISGVLLQNIFLCEALASIASATAGLWRLLRLENVTFNRNECFRANVMFESELLRN